MIPQKTMRLSSKLRHCEVDLVIPGQTISVPKKQQTSLQATTVRPYCDEYQQPQRPLFARQFPGLEGSGSATTPRKKVGLQLLCSWILTVLNCGSLLLFQIDNHSTDVVRGSLFDCHGTNRLGSISSTGTLLTDAIDNMCNFS